MMEDIKKANIWLIDAKSCKVNLLQNDSSSDSLICIHWNPHSNGWTVVLEDQNQNLSQCRLAFTATQHDGKGIQKLAENHWANSIQRCYRGSITISIMMMRLSWDNLIFILRIAILVIIAVWYWDSPCILGPLLWTEFSKLTHDILWDVISHSYTTSNAIQQNCYWNLALISNYNTFFMCL